MYCGPVLVYERRDLVSSGITFVNLRVSSIFLLADIWLMAQRYFVFQHRRLFYWLHRWIQKMRLRREKLILAERRWRLTRLKSAVKLLVNCFNTFISDLTNVCHMFALIFCCEFSQQTQHVVVHQRELALLRNRQICLMGHCLDAWRRFLKRLI